MMEPDSRWLGERRIWKCTGAESRCVGIDDCVTYIPILQTLQALLQNDTVISEVTFMYMLLYLLYPLLIQMICNRLSMVIQCLHHL